jgi:hypothetical protein
LPGYCLFIQFSISLCHENILLFYQKVIILHILLCKLFFTFKKEMSTKSLKN